MLAELPQTEAVINVLINLVPFISELIGMLVVVFLIFGQLGINFFGGNINSSTPKIY